MSALLNTIDFYFGVVSNYFSPHSASNQQEQQKEENTIKKQQQQTNSKPQHNELLEDRSKIFGNSALRSEFAVNSTTNVIQHQTQSQQQDQTTRKNSSSSSQSLINNNNSQQQQQQNGKNTPLQSRNTPKLVTYPSPVPSPALVEQRRKTLILDLDETLVHSTTQEMSQFDLNVEVSIEGFQITMFVSKRPYLDYFLESVAKWYDVVIFTASLSQYASIVIDAIDPKKIVKERLYRQSCTALPFGGYVKDLGTLGKPLSDLVIIDNSPIAYSWHRDNAIPIADWWGPRPDMDEDTSLLDLLPFLEALSTTEDVRSVLSLKDKAVQYTLNNGQQPQQQSFFSQQQQQQQSQIPASFSSNHSFNNHKSSLSSPSSSSSSYAQTVSHVNQPFITQSSPTSAKQY